MFAEEALRLAVEGGHGRVSGSGTPRTCRGCRGELEIGHFIFSTTYDVPRVQGERPHARVQGAAPLPLPSPFPVFPFPFVSFVPFVISLPPPCFSMCPLCSL